MKKNYIAPEIRKIALQEEPMLAAVSTEEDNNADAKPNLGFENSEFKSDVWNEGGVTNFHPWTD